MISSVFYEDAKKSIVDFFALEFPNLPQTDLEKILHFFYKLSNYEEEGVKIRPNIFLTSNINVITKNIPDCQKVCMYIDRDSMNFKQHLKALMCFCRKDWSLYINFDDNEVEYGLIKAVNSIKDKTLRQLIFSDPYKDIISKKTSLVNINVISGGLVILTGALGNKTSICFNLSNQIEHGWDEILKQFVDACVTKLKTTTKKLNDIKNLLLNIFQKAFKGLHGAICLVVDKDYKDKGFLGDGTWLKEPIEFGKLFLQTKSFNENKLISYADLFVTMLDYDGITIIDNAGRIRAYNVFIESSQKAAQNVIGGARKRAAYTLLENKSKKIIGVYFQSQDGDNFYKDTNNTKKKRPLKIVLPKTESPEYENEKFEKIEIKEVVPETKVEIKSNPTKPEEN